jgi:hypothetical protein
MSAALSSSKSAFKICFLRDKDSMQCHQVEITGSGTAFPDSSYLVSFPGAYSPTEPGLLLNIYWPKSWACRSDVNVD